MHGLLYDQATLDTSYKLNVPSSSELGVRAFLTYANGEILKIGSPITLSIANTPLSFKNVYGFNRVYDKQIVDVDQMIKPRADVAVVAMVNGKFQEVCYLALDTVTSFDNVPWYSSINFRADGNKVGNISKDLEVVEFLRQIVSRLDEVILNKKSFYRPVKDRNLIGRAVFGPLYKRESKKSSNNIHARGEGKIFRLSKLGDLYTLRFSNGIRLNERDINIYRNDQDRRVVLSAEYKATARFKVDGKEYKGVRVLLKPIASVDSKAEELSASK
jgi:hypothetical protein